jgi:hypothetical protein
MFLIRCLAVCLCCCFSLLAQPWQVKGHGIGLYVGNGADYDQVLRTVQSGNAWSLKDLQAMSAFTGNGPKVFGAWIQGPHTNTFKNSYGTPVYMYKVRVTNPKGEAKTYGPYGFYAPGFATYFLSDVQADLPGTWKVEWFIVHRETQAETLVATDAFGMDAQKPAHRPIPGAPAQILNIGLYDGSHPDYDEVLRVVRTGSRWSLKELMDSGAFASGSGPKTFGAWYRGPHTSTFTNAYGTPVLMYRVKVTNPKGEVREYGPYGFPKPGFAVYFLGDVRSGVFGVWKVDWFTEHRDTHERKLVQGSSFELVP